MDIFDTKAIKPMLISEMVDPYDDPESIFELKLDGIRCIAYIDNNSVDLRNKRDFKLLPRFRELSDIYKNCNHKCILDGELIVVKNRKPDFYEVQSRSILTNAAKIELALTMCPASFVAYDILYYKDKVLTGLPLLDRKRFLTDSISENSSISISRYIDTHGIALYNLAKEQELEGVVGKKKDSLYWFGKRTKEWNKVKWLKDDDFVAIGYIPKENNMTSLILGKYDISNNLIITNHVTLGVTLSKLKKHGMELGECPLEIMPLDSENTKWIKPLVCTITYMPAKNGILRQPTFKSIRDDKRPEECRIL